MALPDLTNQYIQDTYQRLLQISSSGDLTDGTGSLFIPPNAISSSYATSASYEIIKEVSSSFADTASYVNPLQQDLLLTGSLNISGSVDMSLPEGSAFTIHEPDIDQTNRFDFNFIQGNPILEIAGRFTTGSLHLKQDQTGAGLLLDSLGKIKYITGGTTYGVAFTTTGFNPNVGNQINLGAYNRRWKNVYINTGDKISFGVNTSSNIDLVSFRHTEGTNTLVMSGSSDVTLDVKGVISGSVLALNSGSVNNPAIHFGNPSVGIYASDGPYLNFQTGTSPGGSPEMEISNYILMRKYLNMNNNYIQDVSRMRYLGEITGSNTTGNPLKIQGAVSIDGPTRTLFTSASMVYSGSNVTQVTQSYEAGTQQITNILYSGSFADGNPLSISVTGSDGVNKLYSMTYSGSNITQILVT
jgi:hypothetical protein